MLPFLVVCSIFTNLSIYLHSGNNLEQFKNKLTLIWRQFSFSCSVNLFRGKLVSAPQTKRRTREEGIKQNTSKIIRKNRQTRLKCVSSCSLRVVPLKRGGGGGGNGHTNFKVSLSIYFFVLARQTKGKRNSLLVVYSK